MTVDVRLKACGHRKGAIVKQIFPNDLLNLERVWFGDTIQFVLLNCLLYRLKLNGKEI